MTIETPSSSLENVLPKNLVTLYQNSVNPQQRYIFEEGLGKVIRFDGLTPIEEGFTQTVLDHTENILEWINIIEEDYPILVNELDLDTVRIMIIIHDSGEIVNWNGVKDVNKALNVKGSARIKRAQRLIAHLLIFSHIKDEKKRKKVGKLFNRFESVSGEKDGVLKAQKSNDKEALLARMLDLLDGNRTAQEHYFNFSLDSSNHNMKDINDRIAILSEGLQVAKVIYRFLSSAAQKELKDLIQEELIFYAETGVVIPQHVVFK